MFRKISKKEKRKRKKGEARIHILKLFYKCN